MSPTLVEKDGRIVMSLGAPGGPRIISGVIQVLYRTLVNGWNMDIAIQAPRVHHQFLPDQLYFDEFRLQPATQSGLQALGHSLQASSIARVYGIQLNKKGWLEAAFDSRGEGSVDGF
jgi:gamma-glutamyltranspeptidase/glutathione hydrolase